MAHALHTALKELAPVEFTDVPTSEADLTTYLDHVFQQCELVLESIPIPESSDKSDESSEPFVASSASEIKPSQLRSASPDPGHAALQKEWGKQLKIGAKENALGMSVYKLSAKDGRGSWFARRSVHEGLGFAHFKKGLQQEFEQSLAIQGSPGAGNVRGIGGEERIESFNVPGRGRVEVFRLSAQFPGPTTPRDFVTLLITSDTAIQKSTSGETAPRHYMIISKPCDHPKAQPQNGFIRGSYESIEFIREVPRAVKSSKSVSNLAQLAHNEGNLAKGDAIVSHGNGSYSLSIGHQDQSNAFKHTRTRSTTAPQAMTHAVADSEDDETNPVEWIMVTRSDPGGSVPRFMVERGTPGSICADAIKFLDWACQKKFGDGKQTASAADSPAVSRPSNERKPSSQSFRSSRVAGVEGTNEGPEQIYSHPQIQTSPEPILMSNASGGGGIMSAVYGAATTLGAYTPQVVLNHLPGSGAGDTAPVQPSTNAAVANSLPALDDDSKSIASTTSFASAEDYISSTEDGSSIRRSAQDKDTSELAQQHSRNLSQHEKEMAKLSERRAALTAKFASQKAKLAETTSTQSARDDAAQKKALEKHEKEVKKHEEKYEKELRKIEERQEKERKKMEAKKRKQEDKDERTRLTRERDEARMERDIAQKEADVLKGAVADLEKKNTSLATRLSEALATNASTNNTEKETNGVVVGNESGRSGSSSRSRSGSLRRRTLGQKDKNTSTSRLSNEVTGQEGEKGEPI